MSDDLRLIYDLTVEDGSSPNFHRHAAGCFVAGLALAIATCLLDAARVATGKTRPDSCQHLLVSTIVVQIQHRYDPVETLILAPAQVDACQLERSACHVMGVSS